MLIKAIIHAADISNPVRPFHVNCVLSSGVHREFRWVSTPAGTFRGILVATGTGQQVVIGGQICKPADSTHRSCIQILCTLRACHWHPVLPCADRVWACGEAAEVGMWEPACWEHAVRSTQCSLCSQAHRDSGTPGLQLGLLLCEVFAQGAGRLRTLHRWSSACCESAWHSFTATMLQASPCLESLRPGSGMSTVPLIDFFLVQRHAAVPAANSPPNPGRENAGQPQTPLCKVCLILYSKTCN